RRGWQRAGAGCLPEAGSFQLDQYLPVAALTDIIDGGLDAAAPDVARLSRHDIGLDVLGVRPTRIRLGHGSDPVALDLDQHVVHLVPVRGRPRAGREVHLPDAHAVVLEQETG